MAKAATKGIALEDYLKVQPKSLVRVMLDRGELRYEWTNPDGTTRASDDGGPLPPKGWWPRPALTTIDRERREVWGNALLGPVFQMYFVTVFPAVAPADEFMAQKPRLGRPSSAHLVLQEAIRRLCAGDLPTSRKEFLHQLEKWLPKAHPKARPMAAKTIGDHLNSNTEVRALLPKDWTRRS